MPSLPQAFKAFALEQILIVFFNGNHVSISLKLKKKSISFELSQNTFLFWTFIETVEDCFKV